MASSPSINPTKSQLDQTRDLVEIELEKEEKFGFGFNIIGGVDDPHIPGHTGIFISHIRLGGPAFRDGRLQPGDLIVAVDDILLRSKTHTEAVEVFRQAQGKVRLLIEQDAETLILSRPFVVVPTPLTDSPVQESVRQSILKKTVSPATSPSSIIKTTANSLTTTAPGTLKPESSEAIMAATVIPPFTVNSNSYIFDKTETESEVSSTTNEHGPLASRARQQQSFHDPLISPPSDINGSVSSHGQNGNIPTVAYSHFPSNMEEEDDRISTISAAPSTFSVTDDVPRTPKKPVSLLDPNSPSLVAEAIFISIGAITLGIGIVFAYRYFKRR